MVDKRIMLDEAINTEASIQSNKFLRRTLFILVLFLDVRRRLIHF